jgi:ribosomal protein S18 acetylase RimI-like enzyme
MAFRQTKYRKTCASVLIVYNHSSNNLILIFLSMSKHIFTQQNHKLILCNLRILTPDEAIIVSQSLVKMEPWRTLGYSADTLSNYLLRSDDLLYRYALVDSEKIVGVLCVRYPWLRGACLELLAIFPSQQGKGSGREVINWLESELRENNLRNLWTLVASFNLEARHFYEKVGFVEVGQFDDFIVAGYTELLLRKVLY